MKLLEIFSFEFSYQLRRPQTWLFIIVLALLPGMMVRGNYLPDALYDDFFVNSPFVIASCSVFGCLIWIMAAASVAGEAAARDVHTRMHPLVYTSPVSKGQYLGGKFLAAFALNAFILLAVPMGILLAVYLPGVESGVIGPFRLGAFTRAYAFIALPNAFATTALQFAAAALSRRITAAYIGSVLIFFATYPLSLGLGLFMGRPDLARYTDAIGIMNVVSDLAHDWTPVEKGVRMISLEGPLLYNRLVWTGIGLLALLFTYLRFRFIHYTASSLWARLRRRKKPNTANEDFAASEISYRVPGRTISIPHIPRTFGFATYMRQLAAITWNSFKQIAKSKSGFFLLAFFAAMLIFMVNEHLHEMGTPLLPRTDHILTFLTSPLTNPFTQWVIIPLFIVLYAGELIWREREAGISEMTYATPVPEWVLFTGRFLGLSLVLAGWLVMLMCSGMIAQAGMGYNDFEPGLYIRVLFGLQWPEYLLFALLALLVHVLVNHKYIGHLIALFFYALIAFSSMIGLEHNLLIYGASPSWTYTQMRGFGPSLGPWLWFKLYWAAWALLLAVAARLFWVRTRDEGFALRLQLARHRFTKATAAITAIAIGLIIALGGFIFYNTNLLNEYVTTAGKMQRQADYERLFGGYRNVVQPRLSAVNLRVEIYPGERKADINGTYHLVNSTAVPIDSIHLATSTAVQTRNIKFNRNAKPVVTDDRLAYHIYALQQPLQPGDSLQVSFNVSFEPQGFTNRGIDPSVVNNGTMFWSSWLPSIGYQSRRELLKPGNRKKYGLAARPLIPTLEDVGARKDITGDGGIMVETVVGTAKQQTAIAPGTLQQTWTKDVRRYFHYVTNAPIGSEYAIFSAKYVVREDVWEPSADSIRDTVNPVTIQVFRYPAHRTNADRVLRSVRASLDYYSKQFGPYPYNIIRVIEYPGHGHGMHAETIDITHQEGFTLFNPGADSSKLDLPFAVVAHEVAHQWWGGQLPYAPVEGAGLLTESPAWYSAMGVVRETYGPEHLERLRRFFRQPYPIQPIRQSVPLLRGLDPYAAYRKGPFALYAMSKYMGDEKVNGAYRTMIKKYGSGTTMLPTSADLYRELKAVTPDTLQTLLHDLFEANTFWELKTNKVTAEKTAASTWQVTFDIQARKVVVDTTGAETNIPMNDLIELGVFAPATTGLGEPVYVQKHRIRSGRQKITVMVTRHPERAGIDPYHLLIDLNTDNNFRKVEIEE